MEDKEMPGEEKSRSSEEKSKKSSSSEEGMKHSKEMMEKPRSDDMFSDDKFEKKPEFHSGMGHEEVSNIFDRVKRMTGGPHEAFDHEDFDFDRRHHGKHHRLDPRMSTKNFDYI